MSSIDPELGVRDSGSVPDTTLEQNGISRDDPDECEEDLGGSSAILNRKLQRDSSTKEADPSGRIFR